MASSSLALFLTLSLLLLLLDIADSSSCGGTCRGRPSTPFPPGQGPNTPFPPGQGPNTPFPPGQGPNTPFPPGQGPNTPSPPGQGPNTPLPPGQGPNTPFPPGQGPNTPLPPGQGPNTPLPPGQGRCPRDALKLGVCANVLGLVNATIGAPPRLPCCSLLGNLVDLEAAVCLCTAIRANVLGINLNVPIALSLVLNYCGVGVPPGFQC